MTGYTSDTPSGPADSFSRWPVLSCTSVDGIVTSAAASPAAMPIEMSASPGLAPVQVPASSGSQLWTMRPMAPRACATRVFCTNGHDPRVTSAILPVTFVVPYSASVQPSSCPVGP